ncbi:SDR family NAD(P)-dependent oxidoreductase [Actinomadura rupiterrae]|uniref:SDR family NAD(P)-dependent oxidoreductase n=1 Tax=Actinomadura rupiterrae TaxID=559627 RepID=UPI0020A3B757|nr:SDR family oxidoreductase [Actinomadura rupiterrae]MCP2340212.1 3-oxoacyl-[acyl-carrier protein] reductase [Actinomadura rupiterrae]
MSNEIENKAALVTGGSRGIGAAVAVRLAQAGADVAFTYQSNAEAAGRVVEKIKQAGRRALAIKADGTDAAAVVASVDEAAATFGRLDILVNNAATFVLAPIDQIGADELERTIALNVRAPFLAAQAAARHMTEGGRIVSIGSNVAEHAPFPGLSLYSMSKTALVGMTKGLARDLGARGITVNVVHPGPTDTDMNPADGPNGETFAAFTALNRYAQPDEIAAVVAHLAGPGGAYVSGTTISVDGGFAA